MNTADKTSLYEMSFAFMRRFAFIHVGIPDLKTDEGEVKAWMLNPGYDGKNYATAWTGIDPDLDVDPVSQVDPDKQELYEALLASGDRIAVLWANINAGHAIGPALVLDIASYSASYTGETGDALTNAVISLVYPQLEGLRPDEQKSLIRSLNDASTVIRETSVQRTLDDDTEAPSEAQDADSDRQEAPGVDIHRLKATAEDMFNIEFNDDDDS